MSGSEALKSVQFVTVKGKRFAFLDANDWETLIEWIERLEDLERASQAFNELISAEGDRVKAGWLEWDSVKESLK